MMGALWTILSIAGMLLLVVAYVLNQRGIWKPGERRYLLANAIGAGLLTAYSAWIEQWVFVGLEGFWCVESLRALWPRPASP
jgi:hypothetical protein